MEQSDLIYGTRAVMEAISAGRTIEKILIQTGLSNELIRDLLQLIKQHEVPFAYVPPEKLKRVSAKNHQGVICILSAVQYANASELLLQTYEKGKEPFFMLIDRVTDVRNFGAIARSADSAGVDALVIAQKGNAPVTSDAVKTSAGALNYLPVCRERDLLTTARFLQDSGLKIIACTEKAQMDFYEADLTGPIALVMGSEEDGISDKLLRVADQLVKIPMQGHIASLNVSVAAGIMIYEVIRQRHSKGS